MRMKEVYRDSEVSDYVLKKAPLALLNFIHIVFYFKQNDWRLLLWKNVLIILVFAPFVARMMVTLISGGGIGSFAKSIKSDGILDPTYSALGRKKLSKNNARFLTNLSLAIIRTWNRFVRILPLLLKKR